MLSIHIFSLMLIEKKWRYHAGLWFAVIVLGLITDYGTGGWNMIEYTFSWEGLRIDGVFYTSSIVIYWINFKYICPRYLSKRRSLIFVASFFVLLLLFATIRYTLDEVVFKLLLGTNNYRTGYRAFGYYFFDNIQYAVRSILYSSVIFLVFRFIEAQSRISELKLNHKKAELSFLKSQISPHFLFNTLNTFYSELIESQPDTAKDIHRLSELLRFVTYESGEEFVELRKEISFIEDYIYFYEKRFERELSLDFRVEGEIQNQTIASLAFMHFIENVFKHGLLNDQKDPASIVIKIDEQRISITTRNKMENSTKYMDSGIGVENLRRRLNTIYPGSYVLESGIRNDYFMAFLQIPV